MNYLVRGSAPILFLLGLSAVSFGQSQQPADDGAAAVLAAGSTGYVRMAPSAIDRSQPAQLQPVNSSTILVFPANAATSQAIFDADNLATNSGAGNGTSSNNGGAQSGSQGRDGDLPGDSATIDGLDSIPTFSGAFINQAGPSLGKFFPFTFVGNHPAAGGTTVIPAQITTVSLQLLNADGSLNANVPFTFRDLIEGSPNFAATDYRSGQQIQYADAIHRAQFFHVMGEDWHTTLRPRFVNDVTFTIPRFVNVKFQDGSVKPVQAYLVGTAPDGNHFVLMLDLLFNALFSNQVVGDIVAGNFTTNALSNTLLPNTFLFSIDNTGKLAGCCVLGFHTFVSDPTAIPQPRWVTQFASWISPGLFGAGFQDVTALSHETSEAFADPFLNNATARWQFPGVPANAKTCQSNLEEGDPIEMLPVGTVPLKLRDRNEVFTYHPQIIPLLQWFEMGAKSNAIDGAFSFPDETTLPHSALPCPQ